MSGTYAQTWVCGKHYPHDEPEEQPASEDCPWCQIARLQRRFENRNKDVGELVAEINQLRDALYTETNRQRLDAGDVQAALDEANNEIARLREALAELVDCYEEFDKYPTNDAHPLYRARAVLGDE